MQEVYAALLLNESKQPITIENLAKVLQAAGVQPDEGKLKALVASLEGKNIDEIIKEASTVQVAAKVEEKKEEEKKEEEKKAEEAVAGLSSLFG
ncbi:MAG: 50S ribosomal protein L12 [Candidatus Aenigmatarchaeota archaeon]